MSKNEKLKLGVYTLYADKGGSSQYRAYIFKDTLQQEFDVHWSFFWNNNYVTKYMHNKKKYALAILIQYILSSMKRFLQLYFVATKYDAVFIQKGTIPKRRHHYLNRLKKKGVRIIFDVDDAIYTIKGDNSDRIAEVADYVICGNDTLKKHYQQLNSNCIVLPTVENTLKYESYWHDTFNEKIIGWIGSKTTIDNFDLVIDALNLFTERHPEVKIAIISNTALDYTDRIKNAYLVPWKSETYIKELGKFSIGIMPLKDNEMNRGKCGFKLIQYLNMKKPVVGSPVGVNVEIISGNGYTASLTDEWCNVLEELLYSREIYDNCVSHIENNFFEKYHYKFVSEKLVQIIKG